MSVFSSLCTGTNTVLTSDIADGRSCLRALYRQNLAGPEHTAHFYSWCFALNVSVRVIHVSCHYRSLILTAEYNFIWRLCCNLSILILDRHVDSFLTRVIKNSDSGSDFSSVKCPNVPRRRIAGLWVWLCSSLENLDSFPKWGANLDVPW